jgi:hypothetical protein
MTSIAASPSRSPLSFLILGQHIRVECADPGMRQVIAANFAAMTAAPEGAVPDLHYVVTKDTASDTFSLACSDGVVDEDADPGDLLFALEKDLTVELQRRRADLFFLHAAAIEWNGTAVVLAAGSGSGKSTTTWGMLHHAYRYLSDELCPVDLDAMRVFPYPHALCLKRDPPAPYALPQSALRLGRTTHVPVDSLPAPTASGSRALGGVFLVTHRPGSAAPEVRPIGPAEASARLYATALNALAHPNQGLLAAARIAQHVPCFELFSSDLSATCALLCSTVDGIVRDAASRHAHEPAMASSRDS